MDNRITLHNIDRTTALCHIIDRAITALANEKDTLELRIETALTILTEEV